MSITNDEARKLLHESTLRGTSLRRAVIRVLAEAPNPHSQLLEEPRLAFEHLGSGRRAAGRPEHTAQAEH